MRVGGLRDVILREWKCCAATLTGITAGAKFHAFTIEMMWLLRGQITSPEGGNPSPYHKAHPSAQSSQLAEAATDSETN